MLNTVFSVTYYMELHDAIFYYYKCNIFTK